MKTAKMNDQRPEHRRVVNALADVCRVRMLHSDNRTGWGYGGRRFKAVFHESALNIIPGDDPLELKARDVLYSRLPGARAIACHETPSAFGRHVHIIFESGPRLCDHVFEVTVSGKFIKFETVEELTNYLKAERANLELGERLYVVITVTPYFATTIADHTFGIILDLSADLPSIENILAGANIF